MCRPRGAGPGRRASSPNCRRASTRWWGSGAYRLSGPAPSASALARAKCLRNPELLDLDEGHQCPGQARASGWCSRRSSNLSAAHGAGDRTTRLSTIVNADTILVGGAWSDRGAGSHAGALLGQGIAYAGLCGKQLGREQAVSG